MSFKQVLNQVLLPETGNPQIQFGISNFDIKWLRQGLFEMGFGNDLLWDSTSSTATYDEATASALKDFAAKNQLEADGKTFTEALIQKLIARYDLLQSIELLHRAILMESVEALYDRDKPELEGTKAVDQCLRELGFVQPATNDALAEFAKLENLPFDGNKLNTALATGLRDCLLYFYGDNFLKEPWFQNLKTGTIVQPSGSNVSIASGNAKVLLKKVRAGYVTYGSQSIKAFLESNQDLVMGLNVSPAAINTMIAVSENEGNLDAVNTWDNSFLSFGAFQWTLGEKDASGELPALIKKIKRLQPEAFTEFFGQYGIDIDEKSTGETYGFLSFRGNKVVKPEDKDTFRAPHRAFRFWFAGQDPRVKAVQIQHALSRLNNFYWHPQQKIKGLLLAQIITSQYGVALILDNHVNRPGYVKPCIEDALQAAGINKPIQTWDTADELKLLNAYLKIRQVYGRTPMTNAHTRGLVTKKYLDRGLISAERNSFKYMITGERSLESYNTDPFPQPAPEYNPDDYPIIRKGRKIMTDE